MFLCKFCFELPTINCICIAELDHDAFTHKEEDCDNKMVDRWIFYTLWLFTQVKDYITKTSHPQSGGGGSSKGRKTQSRGREIPSKKQTHFLNNVKLRI